MRGIEWAAGLFEGEGCVSLFEDSRSKYGNKIVGIRLNTTDEDVALSMLEICGGKVTGPYSYKSRPNVKPFWSWSIPTKKGMYVFLLKIRPYMLERRKQAIDLALDYLIKAKEIKPMTQ